jgi:hypothetical protein
VSASIVQAELTRMDLNQEFTDRLSRTLLNSDPSIDDPVNDTGLAPHRGDLQRAEEFACMITLICEAQGEIR